LPPSILINQKKKTLKTNHFSSRFGGSEIQKENSNVCTDARTPFRTFVKENY
jgi:hypothetical protein